MYIRLDPTSLQNGVEYKPYLSDRMYSKVDCR